MKKQVAVIGLGRFGISLATTLTDLGNDVMAIDKDADIIESLGNSVTHAVRADATKESVLKDLGIPDYDMAVVSMGSSIEASVLITMLLKKLAVPVIIARAENELHKKILERIGVEKVILPENDTAHRIAPVLNLTEVDDYLEVVNGAGIAKLKAPEFFVGRTLADVGFGPEGKREVVVLMIQREDEAILSPSLQEVVSHVDVLFITGSVDEIEKLLDDAEKEEKEQQKEREKEEA